MIKQGDVVSLDLEPAKGREQKGHRRALVVSSTAVHSMGIAWVAPITGGGEAARFRGFTVSLTSTGMETDGVVLCHQIRAVDLNARGAKRIEAVPPEVLEEVLDAVRDILEG